MNELILEFLSDELYELIKEYLKKDKFNKNSVLKQDEKIILTYNHMDNKIIEYIALILYSEFANEYNNKYLHTWIQDEYFLIKSNEIKEITNIIRSVSLFGNSSLNESPKEDDLFKYIKDDKFYISLKELITSNNYINIKGLITFRNKFFIKSYQNSVMAPIIADFIEAKEYKEFIKLLKYFVDSSDICYDEVIVNFLEDGTKSVTDEDNNDLISEFMEECIDKSMIDETVSTNDIIISGLISKVPRVIKINNMKNFKEEDKEFMNTLQELFNVEILLS